MLTPEGVFSAIENKNEILKWENIYNKFVSFGVDSYIELPLLNHKITSNGLSKIYFNKNDKYLYVRVSPYLMCLFIDVNAPLPLKKQYFFATGKFTFYNAKITDEKLINQINNDMNINDINNIDANIIKNKYFEILENWEGFIKVTFNITKEFNQFQQFIKNKLILNNNNNNKFDNRKYFINNNETCDMNWLNWNKDEDIIEYSEYVLLDSDFVTNYDSRENFFEILQDCGDQRGKEPLLSQILSFCNGNEICLVCRLWNDYI